MDCARFETTLIDELYEELDELTSAAAKKHVAGCAKCSALLGGFRATRRVAILPLVDPPEGLEDRILAATRRASSQKVVPIHSRVGRAFSAFAAFAVRPQVAIAAVFVLTVGASVVLLRKNRELFEPEKAAPGAQIAASAAPSSASMAPAAEKNDKEEDKKAERPQVTLDRVQVDPTPTSTSASTPNTWSAASAAPTATATAKSTAPIVADGTLARERPANAPVTKSRNAADDIPAPEGQLPPSYTAQRPAPVAAVAPPPPAPRAGPRGDAQAQAPAFAGASEQTRSGESRAAAATGSFATGRAAFDAGRFPEAFRVFDALAASDVPSAMYAARSLQRMKRYSEAAQRFDDLSMRAAGTPTEYQAIYESASCYRAMGDTGAARERLNRLASVPSYAAQAQRDLAAIGPRRAAAAEAPQAAPPTATTAKPAEKAGAAK